MAHTASRRFCDFGIASFSLVGTRARNFVAGHDRLLRATRLAATLGPFVFGFGLRDPNPTNDRVTYLNFPADLVSANGPRARNIRDTNVTTTCSLPTLEDNSNNQGPRRHIDPFQAFAPPAHKGPECSRRAPLCFLTVSGFGRVGFPFPWGCARLRAVIGLKSNTTARDFGRSM